MFPARQIFQNIVKKSENTLMNMNSCVLNNLMAQRLFKNGQQKTKALPFNAKWEYLN